jgi:hypothetical protein
VTLRVIKSILENAEVDYYLYQENFNLVRPLVEGAKFMINESEIDKASELLKDYKLNIWGTSVNK